MRVLKECDIFYVSSSAKLQLLKVQFEGPITDDLFMGNLQAWFVHAHACSTIVDDLKSSKTAEVYLQAVRGLASAVQSMDRAKLAAAQSVSLDKPATDPVSGAGQMVRSVHELALHLLLASSRAEQPSLLLLCQLTSTLFDMHEVVPDLTYDLLRVPFLF